MPHTLTVTVVVQLLSRSDVPYGCPTRTAPALLLSDETVDIRTIKNIRTTSLDHDHSNLLDYSLRRFDTPALTSCEHVCGSPPVIPTSSELHLTVRTLLQETYCSPAPHPRDPPIQAAAQAHQAARAQHQKLLLVRTATPLMVIDASVPSSLTGGSTTAAQWTLLLLEKLPGVPPR